MAKLGAFMQTLWKKYGHVLWFLSFAAIGTTYFLAAAIVPEHHVVHTALDDAIPFVPAFIVPYMLWYVYVPLPMLILCFTDKYAFIRQCVTFLAGGLFCCAFFFLWPTSIDFRPDVSGGGFFERLCAFIYGADKPFNAFPSLHCYEALVIHLTTFSSPRAAKHKVLRAASGVVAALICASTVLVKQHAWPDAVSGCLVAVAAFFVFRNLFSDKGEAL